MLCIYSWNTWSFGQLAIIFQELAEKEQRTHQEYPAVLIKEEEIKNIVKMIDNPLQIKSTVSYVNCFL